MELERDIGGRSNHLCIVLLHEIMPTGSRYNLFVWSVECYMARVQSFAHAMCLIFPCFVVKRRLYVCMTGRVSRGGGSSSK